ncbi:MAG: S1 RNA-binding domain-containing protein [Candidatus Melainabacteria bacterium]|nr:S1 RNA-binding domain-containing protein [Candidatus Melainabacteria bacterium]
MSATTFEELKNKYQNKLTKENEVTCKFLAKLKDGYLVDVNNEWEGFIPSSHINNAGSEQALQESFQALVISGPDKSDRYMVSPKALKEKQGFEKLEKTKEENTALKVTISKVVKGGAEVFIDGLRAFLPGRYIRLPGISQENWINQEIEVLIEELDYKEKKIILNHKKAIDIEKQKRAEVTIQKLNEGDIVEAPVLRVADFGVFVDLGGLDGLIPASELSWGRFGHPKEVVRTGQVIQARIFRIERGNQRVALSIKQVLGDPWEQIHNELEVDNLVSGKVISEAPFGVFVQLKPGIEALLHNSEIPEGMEKPKVGTVITTKIIKIDLEQRKVGLSFRNIEQKIESGEQNQQQQEQTQSPTPESDEDSLTIASPQLSLDNLPLCNLEGDTGEKLEN